jgi:hypothetical protein
MMIIQKQTARTSFVEEAPEQTLPGFLFADVC